MILAEVIGSDALWLLFAWLVSAALAGYLSDRKGYGERVGLASGLLLFVLGPVIWLVFPARPASKWSTAGPIGSRTLADRDRTGRGRPGRGRSGRGPLGSDEDQSSGPTS
jgi:hypothetical protein